MGLFRASLGQANELRYGAGFRPAKRKDSTDASSGSFQMEQRAVVLGK